jgi:CheY-like chemotaxis protein
MNATPPRILIIDDVIENVEVLGETLADNCDIQFATSGMEGLELVRQGQPDLILLDVMMPVMDGYAVCAALKSDPDTRAIPVIFVTAKSDAESESRALAAGAVDFIHKPINQQVVRARVRLHLALRNRERELQKLNEELEQKVSQRTLALRDALTQAQEASRMKSDFLANMSHEIRTPMNAIIGMTHLAQATELSPRQRNYLGKIESSSRHLMGIINDILDLSKMQAGKMSMEVIEFTLEQVIDNVVSLVAERAADKGLELIVNMAPEAPQHLVGDPLRLGQILVNYANNAVKFTSQGEVELKVSVEQDLGPHVRLRFAVRDSGIGISTEQQQRLFKDFEQADTSTTRKFGGTGLGLAIVARLVSLMQGEFGVESEPGSGSTFWFSVPLGRVAAPDNAGDAAALTARLAGGRALVVDDNARSRELLCDMLAALGLEARSAADGASALQLLHAAERQKQGFDVVLLDMQMPDISGVALAQQIRALPLAYPPHLSLVTALGQESNLPLLQAQGIRSLLSKPVTRGQLRRHMMQALGRQTEVDMARATGATTDALFSPASLYPLRGARILLVEDNDINREVATETLQEAGIVVTSAEHGAQALEQLAQAGPFDLVLMDVQMPVMDGYETTAAIRAQDRFKDLPIIAMTANAMAEDRQRCLAAGMNDFVAKPIDTDRLWQALLRWTPPQAPQSDIDPGAAGAGVGQSAALPMGATLPELSLEVDGLDTRLGLKRCMGKPDFYRSLLRQFLVQHTQCVQHIRAAEAAGQWLAAQRVAHTLKSVAGNLGALRLQDEATAIEQQIADQLEAGLAPVLDEQSLSQLAATLERFRGQLEAALGPDSAHPAVSSQPAMPDGAALMAIKETCRELGRLLASGDFAAIELMEQHSDLLKNSLGSHYDRLHRAVSEFDFERGQRILQEAVEAQNLTL